MTGLTRLPSEVQLAVALGHLIDQGYAPRQFGKYVDEGMNALEPFLVARGKARRDFDRLRRLVELPAALDLIRSLPDSYPASDLLDFIREEALNVAGSEPAVSRWWAEIGGSLAQSGESDERREYQPLMLAIAGNSHRVEGNLLEAGRLFDLSQWASSASSRNLRLRSEVLRLEASYHRDCGDHETAYSKTVQAAAYADLVGSKELYIKARLKEADLVYRARCFRAAVGIYRYIQEQTNTETSKALLLTIAVNEAFAWVDAGNPRVAHGVYLRGLRRVGLREQCHDSITTISFERFAEVISNQRGSWIRCKWLEARLCVASAPRTVPEKARQGIQLYLETIRDLLAFIKPLDALIASLDAVTAMVVFQLESELRENIRLFREVLAKLEGVPAPLSAAHQALNKVVEDPEAVELSQLIVAQYEAKS